MTIEQTPVMATEVTRHTLVGYATKTFPIPGSGGNCFSVAIGGEEDIRILNFGLENLNELKRLGLTFPIKCIKIADGYGCINDGRIGNRWYADHFCGVCTPRDLIPLPQRLVQLRQIDRGERTEKPWEHGLIVSTSQEYNPQFK